MQDLRQSTASQIISLGQFLDSTNGDDEENGLTIANTDIKLRKNGATTLVNKNSGGATNISNGVYHATLNATDSNTLGRLEIYVHVAGALAVKAVFRVLTATAFDAIYTGTFNNLGGTPQTADHTSSIAAIPTTPMRGTDSAATSTKQNTMETTLNAIPTTAMRGTDGANTTAPDNAGIAGIQTDLDNATDGLGAIKSSVDAIPTTAMRGTDGANTVVPLSAAGIRSAVGLATANMDTQFSASVTATGFNTVVPPSLSEFNARTIPSADYFDPAVDPVANVTLVAVTTLNSDMVAAAPTFSQIWTTQLTESYAADGVGPTPAQAMFITMQNLQSFSNAGVTQTVKKLDGSTTAATYTYDDATNPTSKTRAT